MSFNNKEITQINTFIGNKITNLRMSKGMSRNDLATKINISGQQLFKYENGTNRISFGRLYILAKALEIDIANFYEKMNFNDNIKVNDEESNQKKILGKICTNVMKIKSKDHQKIVGEFVNIIAKEYKNNTMISKYK